MARYTGPVCKQCRREGMKLFLKGERCYTEKCSYTRRPYPPGQHGQARIKLSEGEVAAMVPELNGILAWVEQLGEVDVTGVEPMTAVIANKLRLRDDVVNADPLTGGDRRDAVLANAPSAQHGFFGVPKVIE